MSLLRSLLAARRISAARELAAAAILRSEGRVGVAAHDLGVDASTVHHLIPRLGLAPVLAGARARKDAPPAWLVRTLSVIEGGVMEAIQSLYEAAAGMSVEDVVAEIEASSRAGQVDAPSLAEALVAGAAAMSGDGG